MGATDNVLCKRSAVNRNLSEVLDKIPIRYCTHDPLSYGLRVPDGIDGRCQVKVLEYAVEGTLLV